MWTEEGMYFSRKHWSSALFIFHLTFYSRLLWSSRGQKLCKNVRDLEHVDVSHCVALSDPAIRAISFYCRSLVTLRMSGCAKVNPPHKHTPLKPFLLISYDKMFLFSPVLPQMTDLAVQYLTSGSQYLQELDVSGCVLLTDRSLRHIERICPPLCSITMACCSSISK